MKKEKPWSSYKLMVLISKYMGFWNHLDKKNRGLVGKGMVLEMVKEDPSKSETWMEGRTSLTRSRKKLCEHEKHQRNSLT